MQRCLLFVLGLVLGCSGTGHDGAGASAGATQMLAGASGSGGAAAGSTGAGGVVSTGGQGQSGATTTGGVAGAPGSAGGTGGTPVLTPALLFPLAVGNKWTFSGPPLKGCASGQFEESFTAYELHGGRMAYESVDTCQPNAPVWLSEQDGAIAQFSGTDWAVSLAPPVEEGAEWDSGGVRFGWHAVPTVTVPAGTFDNCWKRALVLYPDSFARTYCPGIGPTLDEDSGMRTELTAYVVAP
ncbi:MAG TPA: hypothetical protein VNG33_09340 [Polyangiaceae bacterium]|nr:hypothetical protein [Polyangiaceae bacterium]